MKTPEDEAFEDIERRQGGFQAKRAMAADKVQDETDMLTIAYLHGYDKGKKAALAQPAQEPPSEWAGIKAILDEYGLQAIDFVADFKEALAQPAQERPWVSLTDAEIDKTYWRREPFRRPTQFEFARDIEQLLKEKNG